MSRARGMIGARGRQRAERVPGKERVKQQNTWSINHLVVDCRRHVRNLNLTKEQPIVSKITGLFYCTLLALLRIATLSHSDQGLVKVGTKTTFAWSLLRFFLPLVHSNHI